jgi:hypothetical protein
VGVEVLVVGLKILTILKKILNGIEQLNIQ